MKRLVLVSWWERLGGLAALAIIIAYLNAAGSPDDGWIYEDTRGQLGEW